MLATQVQYWNYLENQRHNMAMETQAKNELAETSRANLVREKISQGSLDESVRHNKAGESIGWGNLTEVARHNVEQERIGFANIQEEVRHNKESETLYPYQRDKYQMETTTGYVNAGVNAGDKIGVTPLGKASISLLTTAGMLVGSDIGHSSKGGKPYGRASDRGTTKSRITTTHSGFRPTLSDSDRQKYVRY